MVDIQNWTALLVALTPFLIAWLRGDGLTDNQVTALTLGVVGVAFFTGRFLDGALLWPLPSSMAGELAAALIGQQAIYHLLRKTTPFKSLEAIGLPAKPTEEPAKPAEGPNWEEIGKL